MARPLKLKFTVNLTQLQLGVVPFNVVIAIDQRLNKLYHRHNRLGFSVIRLSNCKSVCAIYLLNGQSSHLANGNL